MKKIDARRTFFSAALILSVLLTSSLALTACTQPNDVPGLDNFVPEPDPDPDPENPPSPNRTLSRIEIASLPDTTQFPMGADFDFAGLTIRKIYNDSSTEISADCTVNWTGDILKTGTIPVTVSAGGKNTAFNITITGALTNTGLPVVYIITEDGKAITSKEEYLPSVVKIVDPVNSANNINTGGEFNAGVRGRGNTTWSYPKKPYRIKFDSKQGLFGLTRAKSWVLLANWLDPTLIMNTVTFYFGRACNFPFANHGIHVDLVLNGVYQGNYLLTEQVQVGEGRVDISETTGFLAEMDSYYDEDPKFRTANYNVPVMIKSPEDLTDPAGYDFVKTAINALDAKMFAAAFPENGYRDLINMDNLAEFMILNELVGNDEQKHPKSTYLYRADPAVNSRIHFGPLWDFDWAFGYRESGHVYFQNPQRRIFEPNYTGSEIGKKFFRRFMNDPQFRARYKARWNANYSNITTIWDFIDETAAALEKSQRLNFRRWESQYGYAVNYSQEIQKLKTYLDSRITYLNTEINKY
jgi:hypothetical protein